MNRIRKLSLALALFCTFPATAHAAPALWQVSDNDSSIWLFGSVHLLPDGIKWRSETFDKILQSADAVYFETDITPEAQMELLGETFKRGMNDIGERLSDSLDAKQTKTLTKAAAKLGMPMASVEAMRPWMASSAITVAAVAQSGYDPASGVDLLLEQEVAKNRQRYFESGSQQIGFLADAPAAEQIGQLIDVAGRVDEIASSIEEMVKAWADGDPEQLATLFLKDLAGYDALAQRLIYDRNKSWIGTIKKLLADNEQDLIVVGTGHLIGDGSVVDLLDDAGFSVKRLQ